MAVDVYLSGNLVLGVGSESCNNNDRFETCNSQKLWAFSRIGLISNKNEIGMERYFQSNPQFVWVKKIQRFWIFSKSHQKNIKQRIRYVKRLFHIEISFF